MLLNSEVFTIFIAIKIKTISSAILINIIEQLSINITLFNI